MKEGRELLVGAVVILGIAAAVLGTIWLQGRGWGQQVTVVEVLVSDVGQLTEGNAVKFRGVSVGRVTGVRVETGGDAVRLTLELQGDYALPEDARAVIAPESLFGDWQCEIVRFERYPRFDYYPVPEGINAGGVRVLGGYALPDISRLTAAADEISENLAVLTDRFDRAFNEETADALAQAIRNVQQVSDDIKNLIQQQASTFENVSTQVERASTEIGEAASVARVTLERVDDLLARGEVDSILVHLDEVSRGLSHVVSEVDASTDEFRSTLVKADSALASIDRLARRVEAGEGTLGMLIADSTLAVNAEGALAELSRLLQDIRENPGRYVRLSIF